MRRVEPVELHVRIAHRDKEGRRIRQNKRTKDDARANERRRLAHAFVFPRSLARCLKLSLRSWPQAARMSRPRGVRMGEDQYWRVSHIAVRD